MCKLIEGRRDTSPIHNNTSISVYHEVAQKCMELKRDHPFVKTNTSFKDVGAGSKPRFQSSGNQLLSSTQLNKVITIIEILFHKFSIAMATLKKKDTYKKLELNIQLANEIIKVVPGLREVRTMHLIQFASLLNVIPIDFYVYTPLHNKGGTGAFIASIANTIKKKPSKTKPTNKLELLQYNVLEVSKIQKVFSEDITPAMLENACCMISRQKEVNDLYYYLPFFKGGNNILYRFQILFRVIGHRKSSWMIEAKGVDGSKYDTSNLITFQKQGESDEDLNIRLQEIPHIDMNIYNSLFNL